MDNFEHIKKYEAILKELRNEVKKINSQLTKFDDKYNDFLELTKYYYSEEWIKDLQSDDENKIPKEIERGVLSEDGIYNLITDYNNLGISLMEIGLKLIKSNNDL